MLHLRISSPAALTAQVLDLLTDDSAVSCVGVVREGSIRPRGDLVTADVAREAANDIVSRLREIGVARDGAIHVEPVQTWLSSRGLDAERRTPGSGADAVVWADVVQRAYDESELNWTYFSFMTLATVIASIAIVVDSQILVIGAMVLGPEFTPVAGIGIALVRRRWTLLRYAARTLVLGFAVAVAVTALAALAARGLGWVTAGDVTGARPDTAFIYTPDKWSLVVAVIAGCAGVLSLTSSRVGGLSGVFISVTTVPALGNIALGLTFGAGSEVWGSTLQLVVNLTGMAFAGWLTLAVQQAVWSRLSAHRARLAERLRSG